MQMGILLSVYVNFCEVAFFFSLHYNNDILIYSIHSY